MKVIHFTDAYGVQVHRKAKLRAVMPGETEARFFCSVGHLDQTLREVCDSPPSRHSLYKLLAKGKQHKPLFGELRIARINDEVKTTLEGGEE